jgi:predicted nucleic acid-binding protein
VADAYVTDTSVFVRWYVPQVGYEHAIEVQTAFLAGTLALETVDFARIELANVLRKTGLRPGRLTELQYLAAVREIDDLGVVVHPTDVAALVRAATLAAERSLSVYDALLADRALMSGLPLLTADARLCRGVEGLLSTELLRGVGGG